MFYLPHTPLILPQLIYFPFLILLFIFNFHPRPHLPYIDPTSTLHGPHTDPTPTFFFPPLHFYCFPPPSHFFCFPSTTTITTATTFLLFSLHHHHHHNCGAFCQPLQCLYKDMQTQEKSFLLVLKYLSREKKQNSFV